MNSPVGSPLRPRQPQQSRDRRENDSPLHSTRLETQRNTNNNERISLPENCTEPTEHRITANRRTRIVTRVCVHVSVKRFAYTSPPSGASRDTTNRPDLFEPRRRTGGLVWLAHAPVTPPHRHATPICSTVNPRFFPYVQPSPHPSPLSTTRRP